MAHEPIKALHNCREAYRTVIHQTGNSIYLFFKNETICSEEESKRKKIITATSHSRLRLHRQQSYILTGWTHKNAHPRPVLNNIPNLL